MAEIAEKLKALNLTVEQYESLTDDDLTEELIDELRFIGCDPPPLVVKKKWTKRKRFADLTPMHRTLVNMAALGKTPTVIAAETGMSRQNISTVLNREDMRALIAHKQEMLFQNDVKGYIKTLMTKSYGVFEEILDNALGEVKPSVRLEAAKYVLDHTAGKATQTHEIKGNLLGDLIQTLDSARNVTAQIAATPDEPSYVDLSVDEIVVEEKTEKAKANLVPLKDEMDELVAQLVPDEFTVGKRDNGKKP